jgi:hypothetical protein
MRNVLNPVGSDDLASCLLLAGSIGVDPTGSLFLSTAGGAPRDDRERTSTACLLKLDDHVVGVTAIFSPLQQKSGLRAGRPRTAGPEGVILS